MSEHEPSSPQSGAVSVGTQRQMEVYQAGVAGKRPTIPIAVEELERKAREVMTPEAYGYVAGSAGSEDGARANLDGFKRWRIVPRFLRDVALRDLSVDILGQRCPAPVLLAPIGVLEIVHKESEQGMARAARSLGIPIVLSTLSSNSLEVVAKIMGDVPHWFQLYWPRNADLAASFVTRAEAAGYGGLVVTLDTYHLGWRERDIQQAYLPFLKGQGMANYCSDPVFRASLPSPPERDPMAAVLQFLQVVSNPSLAWEDLSFLRKHTRLPILLKGILDPDDARRALDHGVDGIIVSNHGGRQLDGVIASIDALPRIVEAVGKKTTLLFDSGIRRGADVFKAIALGAKAVLLGRPYVYGLAVAGEDGVRSVLQNLLADLDLTLGLAGCTSFGELNSSNLFKQQPTS